MKGYFMVTVTFSPLQLMFVFFLSMGACVNGMEQSFFSRIETAVLQRAGRLPEIPAETKRELATKNKRQLLVALLTLKKAESDILELAESPLQEQRQQPQQLTEEQRAEYSERFGQLCAKSPALSYALLITQLLLTPEGRLQELPPAEAIAGNECAICMYPYNHEHIPFLFPCRHTICMGCVRGILETNNRFRCPACRTPMINGMMRNYLDAYTYYTAGNQQRNIPVDYGMRQPLGLSALEISYYIGILFTTHNQLYAQPLTDQDRARITQIIHQRLAAIPEAIAQPHDAHNQEFEAFFRTIFPGVRFVQVAARADQQIPVPQRYHVAIRIGEPIEAQREAVRHERQRNQRGALAQLMVNLFGWVPSGKALITSGNPWKD